MYDEKKSYLNTLLFYKDMKVIVTIPAYNEEKDISKAIHEIKEVMDATNYDYEVLVVNDGSKDKTVEIATKAGAVVYSNSRN